MKSQNRHALVTGATRGIGWAIAERLLAEDYSVTVTGRSESCKIPNGATYHPADFEDPASLENLEEHVRSSGFSVLVNNAGINVIHPFDQIPREEFERIQRVNVHAPFQLIQAALPGMRQNGFGRIVNISSIFGVVSKSLRASYSTSKFALDGLTAALSAEVAESGILANCVSPGFIDTELTRSILSESQIEELVAQVPMRRLGKPSEVAALVAWLVSEENSFVTGQNIAIDGGFVRV